MHAAAGHSQEQEKTRASVLRAAVTSHLLAGESALHSIIDGACACVVARRDRENMKAFSVLNEASGPSSNNVIPVSSQRLVPPKSPNSMEFCGGFGFHR